MKISIKIFLILCLSTNAYSQNVEQRLDSLEFEITRLLNEQNNMNNKIDLHQNQYKNGQRTVLVGLALSILSTVIYIKTDNETIFLVGNSAATIISISGFVITFNSFNFLKKDFDYHKYLNDRPYMIETKEEKIKRLEDNSIRGR